MAKMDHKEDKNRSASLQLAPDHNKNLIFNSKDTAQKLLVENKVSEIPK